MHGFLVTVLVAVQLFYLFTLLVTIWFRTMGVDLVSRDPADRVDEPDLPPIVLFYPLLRELEETMRTTLTGMARADYPVEKLRVICIPNHDDTETIAHARKLQAEFSFLEVMPVPQTSDPSWNVVWSSWDMNAKAYWWHVGKRAGSTDLPPKKTRQLVWAMYQLASTSGESLLSYIDADSVVPVDYWQTAAVGMQHYDVIQNTNITGNLLATWPASFYAMDHISWDSTMYKHMSAHGKHPFYVLGKGLFFRFRDLLEVGGFHPWLTIEDPEIGMRMWTKGATLGVVESPLVEEVPATWSQGVTQRKRWVAGFFQSLASPLVQMGMPWRKRIRARLNFVPCLSLIINPIGFAIGIWGVIAASVSQNRLLAPVWETLSLITFGLAVILLLWGSCRAWQMSAPVLPRRRDRLAYVLRVNPLFLLGYWLWWSVPLLKGFVMFIQDKGLVWERTEKTNANQNLVLGDGQRQRGEKVPLAVGARSAASETGPAK